MKGYIYKLTNLINQKIYIGLTRQKLTLRYYLHIHAKDNYPIHVAMRKYGVVNFKFEIVWEFDLEKASLEDNAVAIVKLPINNIVITNKPKNPISNNEAKINKLIRENELLKEELKQIKEAQNIKTNLYII